MPAKPYVGITGLTTADEIEKTMRAFSDVGWCEDDSYVPMIGILASYKTLTRHPTTNRRYPAVAVLPDLLSAIPSDKFMAMIHYNSRERGGLDEQVATLFAGIYQTGSCRALQLNIAWPDPDQVFSIKDNFPLMKIVLQLSAGSIQNLSAEDISYQVDEYESGVDYVLIDQSGGRGALFDARRAADIISSIKSNCLEVAVGVAGGLNAENVVCKVNDLKGLIGDEHEFSIDCESGIRDKLSERYGDDIFNETKVRLYLERARDVLLKS